MPLVYGKKLLFCCGAIFVLCCIDITGARAAFGDDPAPKLKAGEGSKYRKIIDEQVRRSGKET